jgi:carbon monoxide dehydrogenase subunit G
MARIEGEVVINRPVEEVFDFVADERNEPRFNQRMLRAEKLSPGPVGLGSRFRAVMQSGPRPVQVTIEFTGYQRPRRLASTSRLSTMDIEGTLTFDPVAAGTRMRWSWRMRPRGLLKLLTPVVARIGRRQEENIWTSLKHLLEGQEAPSPLAGDCRQSHSRFNP